MYINLAFMFIILVALNRVFDPIKIICISKQNIINILL
jgi:hypothetical protein